MNMNDLTNDLQLILDTSSFFIDMTLDNIDIESIYNELERFDFDYDTLALEQLMIEHSTI